MINTTLKILLLNLWNFSTNYGRKIHSENLGLEYILSTLRKEGFQADYLSPSAIEKEEVLRQLKGKQYDLIGISLYTAQYPLLFEVIKFVKKEMPKSFIVIGGQSASFEYKQILNSENPPDAIIQGEGEYTFLELARKLTRKEDWKNTPNIIYKQDNKIIQNPTRTLIENLDSLPFPAHETYEKDAKMLFLSAGRGCYGNCTFCSLTSFTKLQKGPMRRVRSAESLIEEVKELKKQFPKFRYLNIVDETIAGGTYAEKRILKFAELLKKEKIKIEYSFFARANEIKEKEFKELESSGLNCVDVGVESAIPRVLKLYRKGTTPEMNANAIDTLVDQKICCRAGFIMFDPFIKKEEIRTNLDFLKQHPIWFHIPQLIGSLRIESGTEIEQIVKQAGLIKGTWPECHFIFKEKEMQEFYRFLGKTRLTQMLVIADMATTDPLLEFVHPKDKKYFKNFTTMKKTFINHLEKILEIDDYASITQKEIKTLDTQLAKKTQPHLIKYDYDKIHYGGD